VRDARLAKSSAGLVAAATALSHRFMILRFAVTAPARLLAAAVYLVDGCPCPPFGFILGHASLFVPFLDVFSLAPFLVGVLALVALRHLALLRSPGKQLKRHVNMFIAAEIDNDRVDAVIEAIRKFMAPHSRKQRSGRSGHDTRRDTLVAQPLEKARLGRRRHLRESVTQILHIRYAMRRNASASAIRCSRVVETFVDLALAIPVSLGEEVAPETDPITRQSWLQG